MDNNNVPTADEIRNEVAQISAAGAEVPSVDSIQTPTVADIPAPPSVEVQPQTAQPVQTAPQAAASAANTGYAAPPSTYAVPPQNPTPVNYGAPVQNPTPVNYGAPVQNAAPVNYGAPVQNAAPVSYGTPVQNAAPQNTIPTGNYQYANTGLLQDESDKLLKKKARNYGLGAIGVIVLFWVIAFVLDLAFYWLLIIPFVMAIGSLRASKAKSVAGWFGLLLSILSVAFYIFLRVLIETGQV